jgi:MerR family transcriptional regulator, light-induced transcriptional regulator
MTGYLRIGEFSDRVGVSAETLRAWERRYDLLQPDRSDGGFRLYSDADVDRVRRMVALLDDGVSAAQAARLALNGQGTDTGRGTAPPPERSTDIDLGPLADSVDRLHAAFEQFDEAAAHRALDELLATFAVETVLQHAVLPVLRGVGERWAAGNIGVAHEHFATNVLRARLLGLGRGWGAGGTRRVVLACPPGEEHDLGLIAFGLTLWRQGWAITFLGADTPPDALTQAVQSVRPDLVMVASLRPGPLETIADELAAIASTTPLVVAGSGATADLADRVGARLVDSDPVTAAHQLAGVA